MFDRDVFVYHLDSELQKLFALYKYNFDFLYTNFSLVTKIAFLVCKDKILIPASNYFESNLSFKIINDLKELNEIGAISLISSSRNIKELLEKKIIQHEENVMIPNYHYKDFINNDNIILPGNLIKREKSASKDIKSAWYPFILNQDVKNKLFSLADENIKASQFEDALYDIPHNLHERAFISQYIVSLLPIENGNIDKTDSLINEFITKSYTASFLDEFHAACLIDIPVIDYKLVLPDKSDKKYCYMSYDKIVNLLFNTKYKNINALKYVEGCNAYELIEFKNSLEWLLIAEKLSEKKVGFVLEKERNVNRNMEDFSDVKIGVITALPKEYAAMKKMMSGVKEYYFEGKGAGHRFLVGNIPSVDGKTHKVALGISGMGNNQASIRATTMIQHFCGIEAIIMTGIAGGIPSYQNDNKQIRLGDVVVSEGITQYDFIKDTPDEIECRSKSSKPSAKLLEAVQLLKIDEMEDNCTWNNYIDQFATGIFSKPSPQNDIIYDKNDEIFTPPDDFTRTKYPKIFLGNIASANTLMKNPMKRDEVKNKFNVLAVEMEASGISDATWNLEIGYIVVRGICDYCDMHKNDVWQEYASLVAAAYTRSIIEKLPRD